jgi:charged multivesicular body protein 7
LGAAVQDAVRRKELIQLKEFLEAKGSVYASSWIPTPWQVLSWGLRALGVLGDGTERVEKAEFVVLGLLEVSSIYSGRWVGLVVWCR